MISRKNSSTYTIKTFTYHLKLALVLASTALITPIVTTNSNELAKFEIPTRFVCDMFEDFVQYLSSIPHTSALSEQSIGIKANAMCEFWYTIKYDEYITSMIVTIGGGQDGVRVNGDHMRISLQVPFYDP